MKKLDFMLGKWSGDAHVYLRPEEPLELTQTEDVQYKLDGLVLLVEGVGRNKSDCKVVFRALGTISFDDETGAYHMRAYNDGRYLESEVKLPESGKGFAWGFTIGQFKTSSVMRINEKGEWTENSELIVEGQPPRKLVEMAVRPQK